MTNHTLSLSDHEHLMSQLPWLANGTLDEQEESELRTHLKVCSMCREELESMSTLLSLVNDESEQTPTTAADARMSLANMQDRIANDSQRRANSLITRIRTMISDMLGSGGRPIMALASISILVLSVWVIQQSVLKPEVAADYQVLSSQEQLSGIKFAVTFDKSLTEEQSTDVLTGIGQQVGLKTQLLSHDQQSFTFLATGDASTSELPPQSISEMMQLINNRVDVVDVQLVP